MEYLDKVVLCVGIAMGSVLPVRTNKVVAGLEPEQTNVFLQQLGRVATRKDLDFADIVARTLNGEAPGAMASGGGGSKTNESREQESKSGGGGGGGGGGEEASSKMDDRGPSEDDRRREEEDKAERRRKKEARREEARREEAAPPASSSGGSGASLSPAELSGDWQRTAELVGSLISKPSMKEKLLSRPPFRFLADTIINISKATGFLDGLFEGSELNPKEIKDKHAKVAWLEKLVNAVGLFWNFTPKAKASKIIAGLEADLTNELLQAVALGAKSGNDSRSAVQRALGGEQATDGGGSGGGGGGGGGSKTSEGGGSKSSSPPRQSAKPVRSTAKVDKQPIKKQVKEDTERPSSKHSRPSTARRRPPKLKENVQEGKSGGTAQPVRGIMTEGVDDEDEDEVSDLNWNWMELDGTGWNWMELGWNLDGTWMELGWNWMELGWNWMSGARLLD